MDRPRGPVLAIIASIMMISLIGQGSSPSIGDGPQEDMFWTEDHVFEGNCTSKPVQSYFFVNDTALSISIEATFYFSGVFPGSDITTYTPDSFVFDSEFVTETSYSKVIDDISKRGRWIIKVSVPFCGPKDAIEFKIDLQVSNRFLGVPMADVTDVGIGEPIEISLEDFSLGEGEGYMLDLGNGLTTEWSNTSSVINYTRPGTYEVKAMVQVADGGTTGWSEAVAIRVHRKVSADKVWSTEGVGIATVLILALLMMSVALRSK